MVSCIVVTEDVQPILGLKAVQHMHLVTVHTENIATVNAHVPLSLKDIENKYPSLFDKKMGLLKENVNLKIDKAVDPVQNPIRRVSIALMDSLKAELSRLEDENIIERTTIPTDWLSSLVTVKKPNGKIRVCIDP